MNRILKRPMFRMGGSTREEFNKGIITDLEKRYVKEEEEKANGGRIGYDNGGGVEPINRSESIRRRVGTYRDLYDELPNVQSPLASGSLNNFLINFGLDLASRSPQGGLISTAALSAKKPFEQFQTSVTQEDAEQRALNRAILGDAIEAESDEEQARLKNIGGKEFEYEGILKNIEDYTTSNNTLDDEISSAQKEIKTIQDSENPDKLKIQELETRIKTKERQRSINNRLLKTLEGPDKSRAIKFKDIVEEYGYPSPEALYFEKYGTLEGFAEAQATVTGGAAAAEGGRIGYAQGDMVNKPMMNQTSSVGQMDYATLRSRLPREITDDVVKMMAESQEALTDFASIRTQQDVDVFNTTYGVNLVLPQEV